MDDAIAESQVGLGMRNVISHFEESFIDQPGSTIMSLFRFCFSRTRDEVQIAGPTDWRSCLSVDILDRMIRVTAEGPPVSDFDPLPALKIWWNSGPRARRPNFND